jgi:hypothetical protein
MYPLSRYRWIDVADWVAVYIEVHSALYLLELLELGASQQNPGRRTER